MTHASYKVPGVEFSHWVSRSWTTICLRLAIAKKEKLSNYIYVINSDGEMAEGSNWEAILFASHHKLDNLILIIDYNKLQSFDSVDSYSWHRTYKR